MHQLKEQRRTPERRGWTRAGENWTRGSYYVSPQGVSGGCVGQPTYLLFKTSEGKMAELVGRNVSWGEIEQMADRRHASKPTLVEEDDDDHT